MKGYHLHLKPGNRPTEVALQKLHFPHFTQQSNLYNKLGDKQLFYSSI